MTEQSRASPRPKQKLSLGCLLGIASSCILAMVVVCLATLILVGLAPDNLPTTTPNPLTPRVVATSTPQVIGSMMVSSEGGQFSKDGLRITIPRGASAQPGELKISRYNDASSQKATQDYRSSTYQIEGDLQSIKGDIEIAIALPPEALSPASDQSSPLVVLESAAVAPSLGKIQSRFPLASRVDAANNQVVAVLKPGAVASATKRIRGLAAPLFQRAELEKIVRVRAENHWYVRRSNAQFSVSYHSSTKVSLDRADDLLKILDNQKSRLEKMGFAVGAVQYPIHVNIEDMEKNGGWNCGWFFCELAIKTEFLFAPKDSAEYKELRTLVGHEFLHAVQYYESSSRPASMNWMDEMAAVWYEPFAADSAGWIPDVVIKYKDFYRDSLVLAPSKGEEAARRHGYGSSIFLRYLTNKYGNSIVPQTFAELKRRNYASPPVAVLNNVLQANSNASLSTEWVRFLQTWFTQAATIWGEGLVPDPSIVAFDAKASGAQYTILSSLKDVGSKNVSASIPMPSLSKLAQGIVMQKADGTWGALVNDSSEIRFQLGDLSGDAVEVWFNAGGVASKVFASPMDMRIDIDAPEDCGVMIYATRRDNDTLVPILGAENYGMGKVSQVVKVSHASGTGTYKRLTLIAFNRGTSPQGTLKTVRVTMTSLLPVLPTPTPTVTHSSTPRPTNTTTRTPTRTLTPTVSPIPKTTPTKDPNVLCGCVTKFQTTVLTKQHFDACKEVEGSKCLGFEVRVTKPWTYNPTIKMCVGSYEYWQSMTIYDPPWALVGEYHDMVVTLDIAQKRCDQIGQK